MTKEMKKYLISLMIVLALSACATLPPLQEMSNARQTIAAAKEMNPMTEQSEKYKKLSAFYPEPREEWRSISMNQLDRTL